MATVTLTWDDKEFRDLLKHWTEPEVHKTLKAAAAAYGTIMVPIVQAATPIARPGNKYASGPGNLQKLTKWKYIAARYGIGVVIAPMGKNAYYRRFVTMGTKPHVILPKAPGSRGQAARALAIARGYARVVHHPGARANPYVERAGRAGDHLAAASAEIVIFNGLDGKRVATTTFSD
jgi:hypothetical protein